MSGFARREPRPAKASSFFVDSIDDPTLPEHAGRGRRLSQWLIFAIALATAIGVAGLFGMLQLLRFTGS